MSTFKIFSGGQTGVDRAALDAAIDLNIEHGGWCPLGRLAEDGPVHGRYNLLETNSSEYTQRTKMNVNDSDATLVIYDKDLKGGTRLTWQYANKINKPCYLLNISGKFDPDSIINWLRSNSVKTLNIAGPRASQNPTIYKKAKKIITLLITTYTQE